jgi:hypothetical protein
VLLEVNHPDYERARDLLVRFAELEKSPEFVHTYRLSPLSLWNAASSLLTSPLDACRAPTGAPTAYASPWLHAGTTQVAAEMASFFRRFRADGGRMDYLVIDYEAGLISWQLTPAHVAAIQHDPRFHRLSKLLGFKRLASVLVAGPRRRQWNLLMGSDVASALNEAIFKPAVAEYPHLRGSNFDGAIMLAPHIAPDINNHYQPLSCVFGNCQSPAFYGNIGGLAYTAKGGKTYGGGPFAVLRYEMIYLQAVQASSPLPVAPWVAYSSYKKSGGYYKELIYQLALRGCGELLYWNPGSLGPNPGAAPKDDQVLGSCIHMLRSLLGRRPRAPIPVPRVNWRSHLLIAARRTADGRILYRVTIPPGVRSVRKRPANRIWRGFSRRVDSGLSIVFSGDVDGSRVTGGWSEPASECGGASCVLAGGVGALAGERIGRDGVLPPGAAQQQIISILAEAVGAYGQGGGFVGGMPERIAAVGEVF